MKTSMASVLTKIQTDMTGENRGIKLIIILIINENNEVPYDGASYKVSLENL